MCTRKKSQHAGGVRAQRPQSGAVAARWADLGRADYSDATFDRREPSKMILWGRPCGRALNVRTGADIATRLTQAQHAQVDKRERGTDAMRMCQQVQVRRREDIELE